MGLFLIFNLYRIFDGFGKSGRIHLIHDLAGRIQVVHNGIVGFAGFQKYFDIFQSFYHLINVIVRFQSHTKSCQICLYFLIQCLFIDK